MNYDYSKTRFRLSGSGRLLLVSGLGHHLEGKNPITKKMAVANHFFPKFALFLVPVITFFLFCANNYYTSLLLIVCALR